MNVYGMIVEHIIMSRVTLRTHNICDGIYVTYTVIHSVQCIEFEL